MPLEQFFNIVACIAVIIFGGYGLLRPYDVADIAHLKLEDANGKAESRINFGGVFLAMGAAPLLINDPAAFQVVGIVFLGAFITRLVTSALDHPQPERLFVLSGVFELVVGLVLFLR